MSNELKILSNKLRTIFKEVAEELREENVSDRTLDSKVMEVLGDRVIREDDIEIRFS